MGQRVCPWWLGYGLLVPFRRLLEDPVRLLGPWVRDGMLVVEPGCGMGYFTLDLARMVGAGGAGGGGGRAGADAGRAAAAGGPRGARRSGSRRGSRGRRGSGSGTWPGRSDLALAIHVVHEVPDARAFFADLWAALKPGAPLLVIEPKGHVSAAEPRRVPPGRDRRWLRGGRAAARRQAPLRRPAPAGVIRSASRSPVKARGYGCEPAPCRLRRRRSPVTARGRTRAAAACPGGPRPPGAWLSRPLLRSAFMSNTRGWVG